MRFPSLLLALLLAAPVARAATTIVLDGPQVPAVGTPEQIARRAVGSVATQLGLATSPTTLGLESVHELPQGGWVVRLQQQLNGVPVTSGIVTVRLDEAKRAVRVSSGLKQVEQVETTPRISGAEALGRARAALGLPVPTLPAGRGRVVVTQGGELAWEVWPATHIRTAAPVVMVDAQTGDVLSIRDAALHLGKADVFENGATARAARRNDGSFDGTGIVEVSIPGLVSTVQGAHLVSEDLVGRNCCPTKDCDGTSPPPMATGVYPTGFGSIPYEIAMCDEFPRAAADANGDFRYAPPREPSRGTGVPYESDGDEFAEVNSFRAASDALTYVRGLDASFRLRPAARPLDVVANFLLPDYSELGGSDVLSEGKIKIERLMRFGNAAYVPVGAGDQLGAGGLDRDRDAVIVFQGERADFSYDRDVLVHEFGHGVVAATANLLDYASDDWGIVDAPGAMNEGFADFLAAANSGQPEIGLYVGPLESRDGSSLRTLENDFSCPSVIQNEVHQDSQHFAAALWAARKAIASSDEDRLRFDRAVLAALRQIVPDSTFDTAGEILAAEIGTTFGLTLQTTFEEAMKSRGVIGCERVLELAESDAKGPFILPPSQRLRKWLPFAPGPMQFMVTPPAGAKKIIFSATAEGGGDPSGFGGGSGEPPRPIGLLRPDQRIHFTFGRTISHDALTQVAFGTDDAATFTIEPGCGEATFFLAFGNGTSSELTVSNVSVRYEIDRAKAKECAPVSVPDAGTSTVPDGGSTLVPAPSGAMAGGCGCNAGSLSLLPLLVVAARFRRRRA